MKPVAVLALSLLCAALPAAQAHESLKTQKATAKGAIDSRRIDAPARNSLYACRGTTLGQSLSRPWLGPDGTIYFADKPVVEGSVAWSGGLGATVGDGVFRVEGNALPLHGTGVFPIAAGSEAARYDRNPNSISAQVMTLTIPSAPQVAAKPSCLPGGPIGLAITGAVFFNALDADNRDAVAHEVLDSCEGHPQQSGLYHYHHDSPCLPQGEADQHSPLVGVALDGFFIYGPRDHGGRLISNDELDECHGHEAPVLDIDGVVKTKYHYHINREFPYTLGCFKGVVNYRAMSIRR
ncbi:YHYH protein [Chitinimonas lacunae]|uniref:YHYH protein n=1 Tax=Chitinimonas lacunae TaxID=1963018 RepID=A0ABV8MQA2_9NEIS